MRKLEKMQALTWLKQEIKKAMVGHEKDVHLNKKKKLIKKAT